MNRTVFIDAVTSDIGASLAQQFHDDKYFVAGASRSRPSAELTSLLDFHIQSDLLKSGSAEALRAAFEKTGRHWSIYISCAGTLEPIGPFFKLDFKNWEDSFAVNSIAQLRVLHALYPLRDQTGISNVALFAGGGTNSPFKNYSSYALGKIALIKMCELIHDEASDLNAFIIGTGWVNTKIHRQTLNAGPAIGVNYEKTLEFLKLGETPQSFIDIYKCINWAITAGRDIVGGRNIAMAHDGWRDGGEALKEKLVKQSSMYKLRRFETEK